MCIALVAAKAASRNLAQRQTTLFPQDGGGVSIEIEHKFNANPYQDLLPSSNTDSPPLLPPASPTAGNLGRVSGGFL